MPDKGFAKDLHQPNVKVTLTDDGWPAIRNSEIFAVLAERGVDIRTIRAAWKGSHMRYLNVTFNNGDEAKIATDLEDFRINDVTVTVTGRESATVVKVRWVPALMGDQAVVDCFQG